MATLTETKVTLDEIARKTNSLRLANDKLLVMAQKNEADLQEMQTKYADFATQLDLDAAANLGDPAWGLSKAEKDILQPEFVSERNRAAAMVTALTGI